MKPMKNMKRDFDFAIPADREGERWNQVTIRVRETETCLAPFLFLIPFMSSC